jgi:hypothetical protein
MDRLPGAPMDRLPPARPWVPSEAVAQAAAAKQPRPGGPGHPAPAMRPRPCGPGHAAPAMRPRPPTSRAPRVPQHALARTFARTRRTRTHARTHTHMRTCMCESTHEGRWLCRTCPWLPPPPHTPRHRCVFVIPPPPSPHRRQPRTDTRLRVTRAAAANLDIHEYCTSDVNAVTRM